MVQIHHEESHFDDQHRFLGTEMNPPSIIMEKEEEIGSDCYTLKGHDDG